MEFDLLLVGLVVLFGVFGLLSGAIKQLRHWVSLLVAVLAAQPLASAATPYMAARAHLSPLLVNVALSSALFFLIYALATAAARHALLKLCPGRQGGRGDRAFGLGLGAAKGAVLLYVLLSLMIFFERPLTDAFGAPPAPVNASRIVGFVRRHDLFDAVRVAALGKMKKLLDAENDPSARQNLANAPELRRLLVDPRLKSILQNGDLSALQNDPQLRKLLDDPRFSALRAAP